MSDREILSADFKLADAQALVARHEGFEDWSALIAKAGNAPNKKHTPTAAPEVRFAVPILYVSDVRRALACYADILGFDILQTSGDPPFYAEVRRGNARLGLRFVHSHAIDPAVRASEAMLIQASIRVGSAKPLYLEYLAAGATFNEALTRDPWGPQYFIVEDPDGNLILFGEEGPNAPKD